MIFRPSSSSSVGYADGYADDCGVVEVLSTIDLFGRARSIVSATAVGWDAPPVLLFARGRVVVRMVEEVSGFMEVNVEAASHSLPTKEW